MQTRLHPDIIATDRGREAERILRSCVHCGFCNATCPTYQLLGNELDGPRGRIYLIKGALEAGEAQPLLKTHLDRCLTCRACETTCPSGVEYGKLLDIGRALIEANDARAPWDKGARWLLRQVVGESSTLRPVLQIGQALAPYMPAALRAKVPASDADLPWPAPRHAERVLLLTGCAQDAATPSVNLHIARLLDSLGVSALPADGCCGALDWHLGATAAGATRMRGNVRDWSTALDEGAIAVLSSASGCGVHVKEYAHMLPGEAAAARVGAATQDIAEFLSKRMTQVKRVTRPLRVAWHAPCSLQHGQRITGVVERLLLAAGHELVAVNDTHLCCGSAGTYSVLQAKLSTQLRDNKLHNLLVTEPEMILSANIGCLTHLQSGTQTPVQHWVELLDQALRSQVQPAPVLLAESI